MNQTTGSDRPFDNEAHLAAERLKLRGGRSFQYELESHAVSELLRMVAHHPERLMQSVADNALRLCRGHSAGISVVSADSPDGALHLRSLAGRYPAAAFERHAAEANPWQVALHHGDVLLFERPADTFPCLQDAGIPIEEALIAPLHIGQIPVGTIWVLSHAPSRHFDAEDGRLLCRLGLIAAVGHRMAGPQSTAHGSEPAGTSEPEDLRQRLAELDRRLQQHSQAADALLRSEERLRLAMEATDFGTFEWDIGPDRVTCSPNVKRLFGFSSGQLLVLEDVLARIHPEDREAVRATIRAAMDSAGRRTYAGEFRTVPVDGHIGWIDARGAVLFKQLGKGPQCMVGIVVDITQRKEREQQLHQTALELGTANRVKDEFMATLAHELRNPLTPIRNGLEILELTGLADPTQRRACSVMARQLRHLVHLVDDLLDVNRITQRRLRLKREIVSIRRIIDNAVETILPQIDAAQHRLRTDIPDAPILLEADPVRISQAVGNLLANSARYTPAGGEIQLRVRLQGAEVEIEVRDNGVGMSAGLLPRVFDMFNQGDRMGRRSEAGLGIGLALTKALVEMHQGRIEAHSDGLNQGSSFKLWFPVIGAREDQPVAPPLPTRAPAAIRRRVLIVDDDADAADSTAALLGLMGHEAHEARDGAHAVQAAQAFEPDLILMDIGMPGMDGHEAARRIRDLSLTRRPLIVALTGWGQESDQGRSADAGFDAHLLKPVDLSALADIFASLDDSAREVVD